MTTKMQFPMFTPEAEWSPPSELPDLTSAKEIAIDLECKQHGTQDQDTRRVLLVVGKDFVDCRSQAVGNHNLLEESPQHQPDALNSYRV